MTAQSNNVTDKNRKTDVILKLKAREGKSLNSLGLIDKRLFTGENNLHAIMDKQNCMWSLAYDNGILPAVLRQRWTGWTPLMKDVKAYFESRNIDIVEILD